MSSCSRRERLWKPSQQDRASRYPGCACERLSRSGTRDRHDSRAHAIYFAEQSVIHWDRAGRGPTSGTSSTGSTPSSAISAPGFDRPPTTAIWQPRLRLPPTSRCSLGLFSAQDDRRPGWERNALWRCCSWSLPATGPSTSPACRATAPLPMEVRRQRVNEGLLGLSPRGIGLAYPAALGARGSQGGSQVVRTSPIWSSSPAPGWNEETR